MKFKNILKWFKGNYGWFVAGAVIFLLVLFIMWAFDFLDEGPRPTIYDPPVISEFRPSHTFVTMKESELIEGTLMGRVIVGDYENSQDKDPMILFTVFIIPHKRVSEGVQVKLNMLSYAYNDILYEQNIFILK